MTIQQRLGRLLLQQQQSSADQELASAAVLASTSVTSTPGANVTLQVVLETPGGRGRVGFFKPFSGVNVTLAGQYGQAPHCPPFHECAAWRLAAALGPPFDELPARCVLRDVQGEAGSVAEEIRGSRDLAAASRRPDQILDVAFFDCLIANQDRHGGNFKWNPSEGRIRLFDHGYAFARPGDLINQSFFLEHRWNTRATALRPHERRALAHLSSSRSLLGLREILEPDRAAALEARCARMLAADQVLRPGDF